MSGLTAIVHNTHDNEPSIVTGIIKRDSNESSYMRVTRYSNPIRTIFIFGITAAQTDPNLKDFVLGVSAGNSSYKEYNRDY